MLQTAAGVVIPHPERLEEQYVREGDHITLNLSCEKLFSFVAQCFRLLKAPVFLALHAPIDQTRDQLYYLDGISPQYLETLWKMYGELLCQDGVSAFAFASHETGEEFFVQKYKIITLYSPKVERFLPLLQQFHVAETDKLVTAWDTFTAEEPGGLRQVDVDGLTLSDAIDQLMQIGLYAAANE